MREELEKPYETESAGHTAGKKGIVISIAVAIVFVLVCNFAAYKYVEEQSVNSTQGSVMEAWLGIQKLGEPVDVLLLGDSSGGANLATGAIADRLGGRVINLGNNAGSSLLMDAWMLSDYITKYGAPRTVLVTRTSQAYTIIHSVEYMSNVPLPWAYWDDFGLAPEWKDGELRQLFIEKFAVLYSDADFLRERLPKIWGLFKTNVAPRVPSHGYTAGYLKSDKQDDMDINTRTPSAYFSKFYLNKDPYNAIKYMADLARNYRFQLYFTLQPEWDEAIKAGLRTEHLAAQRKFISQFTDETYVHIVEQVPRTLFARAQMQNPNHLWHGSERIYTEEIVNGITAIQNGLTAGQSSTLEMTSISLDKYSYNTGDQPVITLAVTNKGTGKIAGGISCLVKRAGAIDANWVARAPAAPMTLNENGAGKAVLQLTAGKLEAGTYDLVVFLRQDLDNLCNETRVEMPGKVIVK